MVLDVPAGRRGLRQSEAVFQHVNNLPELLEAAAADAAWMGSWPKGPPGTRRCREKRRQPGTCRGPASGGRGRQRLAAFPSGLVYARFPAGAGVARARRRGTAFLSSRFPPGRPYMGGPVVGRAGLRVGDVGGALWRDVRRRHRHARLGRHHGAASGAGGGPPAPWRTAAGRAPLGPAGTSEPLSASEDLYAGQFIDRAGVRLGLPFPAGPHLERLAAVGDPDGGPLPVAVRGRRLSFSGPDTAAARLTERGVPAGRRGRRGPGVRRGEPGSLGVQR